MKFRLKEDWISEYTFLGQNKVKKLYDKDHVFYPNIDNKYEILSHTGEIFLLDEIEMNNIQNLEKLIDEYEDIEIIIEEISDDDDILIRNWRIQLDVKTTRKKLREIEKAVNEHIRPLLN